MVCGDSRRSQIVFDEHPGLVSVLVGEMHFPHGRCAVAHNEDGRVFDLTLLPAIERKTIVVRERRFSEGLPQEIGYNERPRTIAPPGGPGPTPVRDGTGLDSAASFLYFMDRRIDELRRSST